MQSSHLALDHFNAVTDVLEECIASEGIKVIHHYLDDFAVLGPPDSAQYSQDLGNLRKSVVSWGTSGP